MNIKKLKRSIKEQGLYPLFLCTLIQSKRLKLVDEYLNLCDRLNRLGFLKEFLILSTDKQTLGLKGFIGYDTGNFNHVGEWMRYAPKMGAITYNGMTLDYSEYMKIKNIVR